MHLGVGGNTLNIILRMLRNIQYPENYVKIMETIRKKNIWLKTRRNLLLLTMAAQIIPGVNEIVFCSNYDIPTDQRFCIKYKHIYRSDPADEI